MEGFEVRRGQMADMTYSSLKCITSKHDKKNIVLTCQQRHHTAACKANPNILLIVTTIY